jgi:dTDP-4-dehydrorhamnose reductase
MGRSLAERGGGHNNLSTTEHNSATRAPVDATVLIAYGDGHVARSPTSVPVPRAGGYRLAGGDVVTRAPLKVLVTGSDGLLAHHLRPVLSACGWDAVFCRHAAFDLTDAAQMSAELAQVRPAAVINTAAYNAVDRCETDRDRSWAVNAAGPAILAALCAQRGIRLVHYGTDYVFDGARHTPYAEEDAAHPLNHYGAGKLAGEQAVLRAAGANLVLRTSWLFGWQPGPRRSFVDTVLAHARAARPLRGATDQVAVPTFAGDLAAWTLALLDRGATGLFHAVNDGGLSRLAWMQTILEEAAQVALLPAVPPVEPVLGAAFGTAMHRPAYSVLDSAKLRAYLGHPPASWREGLRKTLVHLKTSLL